MKQRKSRKINFVKMKLCPSCDWHPKLDITKKWSAVGYCEKCGYKTKRGDKVWKAVYYWNNDITE